MRNLKRPLSMLLAGAMLIGMMVVGASAAGSLDDFSDKDEIVNQDAVSLLTILGVIEGKEDGSYFDPTGNVTRAEMAKMIATILNQGADIDGLYTGMNTGLTDVSGHWAESYINYCYSLGIIAGRGDGTFDPGATVTGNEAAKMLLVAVGYDANIEGLTGNDWAIRTAALASNLGIFDNLTVATSSELTRDNAALLVYNALDIEMIQRYENGYAIVYSDYRTLLSNRYGVYRLQGTVVANEWAQLMETPSEDSLATGKTRLADLKLVESDTISTRPNSNNSLDGEDLVDTTFNVSTPVEYLGQTVTLYVRNTTVLANAEVLGVYLKEGANTVVTSVETEDTMRDILKGTGLSTDGNTEFYVNYGYVRGDETEATEEMDFAKASSHLQNLTVASDTAGNSNGYGIEMTIIDNDDDGIVDYVLYMQETLSHVISKSDSRETTTIQAFNNNAAIDNEDIVTEADIAENDLVLVTTYGGRYYVSEPQTVTGQMDDFTASKTDEQTITIDGTEYNPSYIQYEAFTADNTYEFDISLCDRDEDWSGYYTEGVQFDTDYNFILDSNGNVIAFQPSELGLYDYALVLDSGYEPGAFASDASGKVKVLLPDGTEGTYTLNFSASAKNVGNQIADDLNATYTTNMGIQQLKAFLGTSDSDNSATAPWAGTVIGGVNAFAGKNIDNDAHNDVNSDDYRDGNAKGYVIGYSLNSDNVLTITSIVGTNQDLHGVTYDPADYNDTVRGGYDSGSGRLRYTTGNGQLAIDLRTVAFYYDVVDQSELNPGGKYEGTSYELNDVIYGVAVGYNEMPDIANYSPAVEFVANTIRNTNLASVVLFEDEGAQAEKDYVFVLSRSRVTDTRATLNVVFMDGTVGEITIDRDDYRNYFRSDSAYEMAYAYTTGSDGITDLTFTNFPTGGHVSSNVEVVYGYAWDLKNGTIEVYENENKTNRIGYYSFNSETVWNVEDEDGGAEGTAVRGNFSDILGSDVVIVTNKDDGNGTVARAVFIRDMLDTIHSGAIGANMNDLTGGTFTTNSTGNIANAVVTGAASRSTLSFEWFMQTNQTGNYVSLADNANFQATTTTASGTTTSTLSVLNANVLPVGTHNFRVVITYTEAGKASATVTRDVPVTVTQYTAQTIAWDGNDASNIDIYADENPTALTETNTRTGMEVTLPDGTSYIYIKNTAWNAGDHYTFNGVGYDVDSAKSIKLNVADLTFTSGKATLTSSDFAKVNVLTYDMGGHTSEQAPAPVYSASSAVTVENGPTTVDAEWQFLGWWDAAASKLYGNGGTVDVSTGDVTLVAVYGKTSVGATNPSANDIANAGFGFELSADISSKITSVTATSTDITELNSGVTSSSVGFAGGVLTPVFSSTSITPGTTDQTITFTMVITCDSGTITPNAMTYTYE